MSSLKPAEAKLLEDLFGMASGYVLDFSNDTFRTFFRQTVNIDIWADKYHSGSGSKGKRLRTFWEKESDPIVGRALHEMLAYWKVLNPVFESEDIEARYNQAQVIANRLLGKPNLSPEEEFLRRDFGNISFKQLPIEADMIELLEQRLKEATRTLDSKAPLATIFFVWQYSRRRTPWLRIA
ncbi:MAG: hypothetical protein KIT79_15825 [Deltaproteobacteria bacterium]|nr:hypothetical protein [Deltaproteobacteria bacterium]